jgi:hypothetical protein
LLGSQVRNFDLDAVPAPWLRHPPRRHRLARSACTGAVEQEAQAISGEAGETGRGVHLQVKAEHFGVERNRRVHVMDDVANAKSAHNGDPA